MYEILKNADKNIFENALKSLNLYKVLEFIGHLLKSKAEFDSYYFAFVDSAEENLILEKLEFANELKSIKYREKSNYPLNVPDVNALCFNRNKILHLDENNKDKYHDLSNRIFNLFKLEHGVFLPISKSDNVIGVLSLINHNTRISENTVSIVKSIINEYFWLIDNALKYTRLMDMKNNILDQAKLNDKFIEISESINNLTSTKDIYKIILKHFYEIFKFDIGFIFIEENNFLNFKEVYTTKKKHKKLGLEFRKVYATEDIKISVIEPNTAGAECFIRKTHFYFEDALNAINMPMSEIDRKGIDLLKTPRTCLITPILHEQNPIGILQLYTLDKLKPLSSKLIKIIKALCSVAGTAISNARVYTLVEEQKKELIKTRDELESLNRINVQINQNLDFEAVFNQIYSYLKSKYGFNGCGLALVTPDNAKYIVEKSISPDEYSDFSKAQIGKIYPLSIEGGGKVADCIINHKTIYQPYINYELVDNAVNRKILSMFDIRTTLHIPIRTEKETIGSFLLTGHATPVDLSDDDLKAIERFANQIAIVLQNSKLYQEVKKKKEQIESLNEITKEINMSIDFRNVFYKIFNHLSATYGFNSTQLNLLSKNRENYVVEIAKLTPELEKFALELQGQIFPLDERGGRAAECIQKNRIFYFTEVDSSRIEDKVNKKMVELLDLKTALHMPISVGEKVIGSFALMSLGTAIYLEDEDISAIQHFVNQIAAIIRNSKLYEEMIKQSEEIEQLNEISKQISMSLDFDTVLYRIIDYLNNSYGFDGAYLNLIKNNRKEYVVEKCRFPSFMKSAEKKFIKNSLPLNIEKGGRTAQCMLENKHFFFTNIEAEKIENSINKQHVKLLKLKSVLHVPISIEKEVIGALSITAHNSPVFLNNHDIESIKRFVNQIAVILRNSKLYEELEKERSFSSSLVENSPYGIEVLNKSGVIVYINSASENISGYKKNNLIGQNWLEYNSIKRLSLEQAFYKTISGQTVSMDNVNFLSSISGEEKLLNITFTPVFNIEGKVENVLIIYYDNTDKAKAELELKKLIGQLQEKDKVMSEDLHLAKTIQTKIVSSSFHDFEHIDITVYFKPMMEVGGDIYDVFSLDKNYYRIFIADATGHGIQAALTTMIIKSEYDKIKVFDIDPGTVLKIFNNVFVENYYNLNVFFTCVIIDIDIENEKIIYASAGHPDQYLICEDKINVLAAGGKMVGVKTNIKYEFREINFPARAKVLLFTDGLYEEFNGDSNELGEKGLFEIIAKHKSKNIEEMVYSITQEVENFIGKSAINDDITVLGVQNRK